MSDAKYVEISTLDKPKKPLTRKLRLSYSNLFWIFMIGSVVGLLLEDIFHFVTVGGYENRFGLVWGPFSPIYGCGACLMTIALYKFWDKNWFVIFAVSGLIGSAFEWCTSFFMQTCFGAVCWDYSGTFGSIGGRTNFAFAIMWGLLGIVWVKIIFPPIVKLVDAIPFRWSLPITIILSIFMALNITLTLCAFARQAQRQANIPASNGIERLCDDLFPTEWMQHRFANMQFS
jgi:uncharacterized membrane protein